MKRFTGVFFVLSLCLPLLPFVAQSRAAAQASTSHYQAVSVQGDQGNPEIKVWVNTASGVYHCPGTRWYGATKQGTYMRQADAQKKGYRPAYGRVCR